mmetsp:Transcript_5467/g.14821  ORF Transcript_5467/g.14821 Transcript_5467/m.14821 type:complete len:314 (+) Transcript_5467:659-1600(+)
MVLVVSLSLGRLIGILLLVLLHQLFLGVASDLSVSFVLHGELSLALRLTAQLRGVSEHVGQRDFGDDLDAASVIVHVAALNHAHASVQGSDDTTLEFRWDLHLHAHHGFHHARVGSLHGVTHGGCHAGSKGHVGRVHRVASTVLQDDADAFDFAPDEGTLRHGILGALLAAGVELRRNIGTNTLVQEGVWLALLLLLAFRHRFDVPHHSGVLTGTASLLLVNPIEGLFLADGLLVCHVGLACHDLHVVLSVHALDVNLEMQFAHSTQNRFLRLCVHLDTQGWILLGELVQCLSKLHLLRGLLWLHGKAHHGFL